MLQKSLSQCPNMIQDNLILIPPWVPHFDGVWKASVKVKKVLPIDVFKSTYPYTVLFTLRIIKLSYCLITLQRSSESNEISIYVTDHLEHLVVRHTDAENEQFRIDMDGLWERKIIQHLTF